MTQDGGAGATDDALEIRIAPVMTGGVSLAVWMGGVTCELYRAVCRDGAYAALLDTLGERVVVDVITGTSAGGLNGVLLATALARNLPVEDFARLRDVWLDDAALSDLLRSPFEPDPPSLLKGDELFLVRIRHHLESWYAYAATDAAPAPDSGATELTLMVTATTLSGEPERFEDSFGQQINQSTHKALFTFRRADLLADGAPARLALAARTSASFPGAFEPSYCPVNEVGPLGQPDVAGIASFSRSHYAIDGGVLRNLPLDRAIDAVFRQPAYSETFRILAYVNPDPPPPLEPRATADEVPSLAPVVGASLVSLPRHETISADLREIDAHNRRVRQQQESRRNILRVVDDVPAAAAALYESFRKRRITDSISATSAQIVRRAPGHSISEDVARQAEDALVACGNDPDLWFPEAFPPKGRLVPEGETSQAPWPWGISTLEYAGSTVLELLRGVIAAADPGDRAGLYARRGRVGAALKALGAMRVVDDAYWAIRTEILATARNVETWADESYREWPEVDPEARERVRRQVLLDTYDAAAGAAVAELGRLGVEVAALTPPETLRALYEIALVFATVVRELRRELRALTEGRLHDVVKVILQDSDPKNLPYAETIRRLLAIYVVQVALGGASSPREQAVELLQVSADVCHGLDARRRGSARGKLTGVGLHHFASFVKRSWRANDWMWGRLDGADRLVLALLQPERLMQRYATVDEACAAVRALAIGNGDGDGLAALFEEDKVRAEIEAAYTAEPGGRARTLPASAAAVVRRLHLDILREELPAVAEAVRHSDDAGGAFGEHAAAFVRGVETAGDAPGWSAAVAADLLEACRIGEETVATELSGDAMTLMSAQAAAVTATALRGRRSGLGPARNVLRSFRTFAVMVYALARAAVTGGPVGTMVVAGGLAASGTVLAVRLAGLEVGAIWVAASLLVLVVWTLIVVVTSATPVVLVPLAATAVLAVSFNGDRLAEALSTPATGWRAAVVTNAETSGRVVAGAFAIAMLVTVASSWSSVAERGWRRPGTYVRWGAALAFGVLAWYAKVHLPCLLPGLLDDPSPSGTKQGVVRQLEHAYDLRVVLAAALLPVGALLLEPARRLPRAVRRGLWLLRSSRFTPPARESREKKGAYAFAALTVVLLNALPPLGGWGDFVRLVLGFVALRFALFLMPRYLKGGFAWLGAGLDRREVSVATRAGGQLAVALCLPVALAWASGLFALAENVGVGRTSIADHLLVVVGVACLEEVVFRGVLLRLLAFDGRVFRGAVQSSVAFGLSHVVVTWLQMEDSQTPARLAGVAAAVAFTTGAGMVLAWLAVRTKTLVAPVIVHASVNAAVYLAVVGS